MRILQVLPSFMAASGGPPRSTLAACRALHSADPDVETVLVTTDEGLDPGWWEAVLLRSPRGMSLRVFRGRGRHTTRFSMSLLAWIVQHVSEFDLVVIRALLHPISSGAARLARARHIPYVVVPHGTLSRYTFRHRRPTLKRLYYRLFDAPTVRGATALHVSTLAERDEAQRLAFQTPMVVIPHPFEPECDGAAMRLHPPRVLFLARFDPKKGIPLLLEAMQAVRRDLPDVTLVLAGSGLARVEAEVRFLIRRLGLAGSVHLPGFVEGDAKKQLLLEASVFVLPSQHENFGISVVEAMDAGLPVVISRGVDIWPEVEGAQAGIVVEAQTPHAFAGAILRLLRDEKLRSDMGSNGRALVRSAFDPLRIGRQLSRFYRAAAGARNHDRKRSSRE